MDETIKISRSMNLTAFCDYTEEDMIIAHHIQTTRCKYKSAVEAAAPSHDLTAVALAHTLCECERHHDCKVQGLLNLFDELPKVTSPLSFTCMLLQRAYWSIDACMPAMNGAATWIEHGYRCGNVQHFFSHDMIHSPRHKSYVGAAQVLKPNDSESDLASICFFSGPSKTKS
jgi:hypothetical protein